MGRLRWFSCFERKKPDCIAPSASEIGTSMHRCLNGIFSHIQIMSILKPIFVPDIMAALNVACRVSEKRFNLCGDAQMDCSTPVCLGK